jgi:hypothetical protein
MALIVGRSQDIAEAVADGGRLTRRREGIVRVELAVAEQHGQDDVLRIDRVGRTNVRRTARGEDLVLEIGREQVGLRSVVDLHRRMRGDAEAGLLGLDDAIVRDGVLRAAIARRTADGGRRTGTAIGVEHLPRAGDHA